MSEHRIALEVNGEPVEATVESRRLLVDFLRYDLGLVGVHVGCEHGVCGTCTVLLDGRSARSCIAFAVEVDGSSITTVEGLAPHGRLNPLQEAFLENHGLQCGYCTPGMLLRATEFLRENPAPTRAEAREAIASNLCRCTGYQFIVDSLLDAASRLQAAPDDVMGVSCGRARMTMTVDAPYRWIGKSIPKVEDRKFLLGRGNYVDDLSVPGMLHAAMLRSPHAHARIRQHRRRAGSPAARCRRGRDLPRGHGAVRPDAGFRPGSRAARVAMHGVRQGALRRRACSRDRRVEPLRRRGRARSHRGRIRDPRAGRRRARARWNSSAPLVHEGLSSNVAIDSTLSYGDVEAAFANAALVVRDHLYWGRTGGQPLETVGAVASYDPATGLMTIHSNSVALTNFLFLLAKAMKIPANKLDLHPHPAGGSFGSKFWAVRVNVLAGMLSKVVGRPVKYVEDRLDNLSCCDHHGSERSYDIELAVAADGTFTGLRLDVVDDYGAYIQFGLGTHGNAMAQVVGPYRIDAIEYRARGVFTNKCQQGAYRGFGSEVHNFVLERIVDLAARELGEDPVELRRRNFIRPEQFPYKIPGGNEYDSGDYEAVLDKALELADLPHWRREQERLRKEGRHIGIGLVTCQERSVYAANEWWFFDRGKGIFVSSVPESITLSVDATGGVTATLYSTAFWGNSA